MQVGLEAVIEKETAIFHRSAPKLWAVLANSTELET